MMRWAIHSGYQYEKLPADTRAEAAAETIVAPARYVSLTGVRRARVIACH
jgi:hypothetical protein